MFFSKFQFFSLKQIKSLKFYSNNYFQSVRLFSLKYFFINGKKFEIFILFLLSFKYFLGKILSICYLMVLWYFADLAVELAHLSGVYLKLTWKKFVEFRFFLNWLLRLKLVMKLLKYYRFLKKNLVNTFHRFIFFV